MTKVICLGEMLVDFVPAQQWSGSGGTTTFLQAAGGAPANVAVGLARLGVPTAFIGCVGEDNFGRFLVAELARHGVDTTGLQRTAAAQTALSVVSLDEAGDRAFAFYGNPAAHLQLAPSLIDDAPFRSAAAFHFGSITLAGEPARAATLRALDEADRAGALVSFDPNYRPALWHDQAAAIDAMRLGVSRASIVKLSDGEAELLGGGCDLIESGRALWHPRMIAMLITRGPRGCLWLTTSGQGEVAAVPVRAIDTTGAGDAFTAAFLAEFLRMRSEEGEADLEGAARFATAAGTLATLSRGAIPALPTRAQIGDFMLERPAYTPW